MSQPEAHASSEDSEDFTSEFSHLYKNTGRNPDQSQQERREFYLNDQKERRHSLVDKHRDFSELFLDDEGLATCEDLLVSADQVQDMEVDVNRRKNKRGFSLMHSEWLVDVPPDLDDNWLVKFAPEGFRVLLIAKKFHTVLLNKRGKVLTLKTHLPGGGLSRNHGLTVLDCIYHKLSKTIFVLDCLYWNTMSMLDSETTFRFYWLRNQFEENAKMHETSKAHKIQLLEFMPADKGLIQGKMFQDLLAPSQTVLYHGIVFYHKQLHYTFKQTPLLGWLYCYMLPEKLAIDVPETILSKMPKNYQTLEKLLETLAEKQANKLGSFKELRQASKTMDTS